MSSMLRTAVKLARRYYRTYLEADKRAVEQFQPEICDVAATAAQSCHQAEQPFPLYFRLEMFKSMKCLGMNQQKKSPPLWR
ncbi:hypothetical protein D3C87_703100 [compost metagenome]